ncbi:uncharacterized protein STEHIDRAFT_116684 [Stereum hirsutum FP-91666 SS1]|uniref:Uncharacterized protein n=1 Tax=Stereum hirsutum (strain FP-91666) TaxID=721885 RepID=R7RXX8_STEHR|nr:uncharacterized protein STEHIDRAFT_116684 [Stereum hirsutum FP-91666 SS1]EIM79212.1 hypothetical protein STEHIDRAFT_116684 [Stereum hirsutum FP-91666 SS1]
MLCFFLCPRSCVELFALLLFVYCLCSLGSVSGSQRIGNRRERRQGPVLNVLVQGATKGVCLNLSSNAPLKDVWFQLRRRHLVPAITDSLNGYVFYPSYSKRPIDFDQTLGDIRFEDGTHLYVCFRLRGANNQPAYTQGNVGSSTVVESSNDDSDLTDLTDSEPECNDNSPKEAVVSASNAPIQPRNMSPIVPDGLPEYACDPDDSTPVAPVDANGLEWDVNTGASAASIDSDGLEWIANAPGLADAIAEELDKLLPADPRFARAGHLQHRCVSSPVSLKDVVMIRACSKDQTDLNRDPAVRRTYRRNNAGRLESMDTPIPSRVKVRGCPQVLDDKGKRPLIDQSSLHAPPFKRCRTSNNDSLSAYVPGATEMSDSSDGRTSYWAGGLANGIPSCFGRQPYSASSENGSSSERFIAAPSRPSHTPLPSTAARQHPNIPGQAVPMGFPIPPPRNSMTMQELEAKISQKNEKKKNQNAYRSRKRLQAKTVNRAEQISTNLQFDSLSISSTGWMGRRFDGRENAQMKKRWSDRTIESDMVDFQRVPFRENLRTQPATDIRDCEGRLICKRSMFRSCMLRLLPQLQAEAVLFWSATTLYTLAPGVVHSRGPHKFTIFGHDRNNKKVPALNPWHVKNKTALDAFFAPGSAIYQIQAMGMRFLEVSFPEIVARYKECHQTIGKTYGIWPMYGLFYNFCLNGARPGTVSRVYCEPHVDWKNIAIGVCLVFVYGNFDHKRKAWLVIWEAGVIIEIPAGVFVAYPSSLFYHFNWDIEVVTTEDGSRPTRENSQPLDGTDGRGSAVWFNQATMFQSAETGYDTMVQAKAAGADTTCKFSKDSFPSLASRSVWVQGLHVFHSASNFGFTTSFTPTHPAGSTIDCLRPTVQASPRSTNMARISSSIMSGSFALAHSVQSHMEDYTDEAIAPVLIQLHRLRSLVFKPNLLTWDSGQMEIMDTALSTMLADVRERRNNLGLDPSCVGTHTLPEEILCMRQESSVYITGMQEMVSCRIGKGEYLERYRPGHYSSQIPSFVAGSVVSLTLRANWYLGAEHRDHINSATFPNVLHLYIVDYPAPDIIFSPPPISGFTYLRTLEVQCEWEFWAIERSLPLHIEDLTINIHGVDTLSRSRLANSVGHLRHLRRFVFNTGIRFLASNADPRMWLPALEYVHLILNPRYHHLILDILPTFNVRAYHLLLRETEGEMIFNGPKELTSSLGTILQGRTTFFTRVRFTLGLKRPIMSFEGADHCSVSVEEHGPFGTRLALLLDLLDARCIREVVLAEDSRGNPRFYGMGEAYILLRWVEHLVLEGEVGPEASRLLIGLGGKGSHIIFPDESSYSIKWLSLSSIHLHGVDDGLFYSSHFEGMQGLCLAVWSMGREGLPLQTVRITKTELRESAFKKLEDVIPNVIVESNYEGEEYEPPCVFDFTPLSSKRKRIVAALSTMTHDATSSPVSVTGGRLAIRIH